MSKTAPDFDRDAQMLDQLAEMDLALAEHLHARLLAATEPDVVAALYRAYQRVAHSLRQTRSLAAKLAVERAQAAARHASGRPRLCPTPARGAQRLN